MRIDTVRRSLCIQSTARRFAPAILCCMVTFDPDNPLARCHGEPRTSNAGLLDYYRMGSGRSIRALATEYRNRNAINPLSNPPTLRVSTILTWSGRYDWQARIARREELDLAEEKRVKTKALEESAKLWAERRLAVRDRDWNQGEAIRNLTDEILARAPEFIKTKQRTITGKNGAPDTVIITRQLDIKLMIDALSTSSKLQRLAAEMETEHSLNENTTPEDLESIRQKRWAAIQPQLEELSEDDDPADVESDTGEPEPDQITE